MRRIDWNGLTTALVLVRLGQELGTDSPLARAVFSLAEIAGKLSGFFHVDRF
jgi:hypothetical protein